MRRAVEVALPVLLALLAPAAAAQSQPAPVLSRPVSIEVREASLADVLFRLRREYALPLAWSGDILPPEARVTLRLRDTPLATALATLLDTTGLGYAMTQDGTVVIVLSRGSPAAVTPRGAPPRLATGLRRLDQIVVMGSAVAGGPEREQPTAVTVAGRRRLAEATHVRTADLVRTMLPGIVLWDQGPGGPPATIAAVRGVSSFTTRGLKTYVDDIEVASPDLFTLVDGRSIEQLELLRGPQGAALYGPDALSGILQVVTRKGQLGTRPRMAAEATAGPYQRADLPGAALWQEYAVRGEAGSGSASGAADGSYTRAGHRLGVPWLSSWTAHAGGRVLAGPFVITGSARGGRYEYGAERPGGALPSVPQTRSERGVGVTIRQSLGAGWQQALMAGTHWISGAREPERSVLTPRLPLGATHETARRTSLRYAASGAWPVGAHELGFSAGAEYSRRQIERAELRSASATDLRLLYDDVVHSTGVFAQSRARLGTRVVLSGGARAEWPSTLGARQGTAWATTLGASWNHPVGGSLLRLRAAWGRGIRPPEPGMSRAMASPTLLQLPNADLAAEAQQGYEAGVELHAGEGFFAGLTWFDQRADDLIQQVPLRDGTATIRAYQFQNVGAITNRGVELEAGWQRGRLAATGALYLTRSRVARVARRYTGDFQPGDPVPEVPEGVGLIRVAYRAGAARLEAGAAWTGSWTGYDWAAAYAAGPARSLDRDYWIRYPGAVRPWVAGTVQVGARVRLWARVDNPGKQAVQVRDNLSAPVGRVAIIGLGVGSER